MAGTNKNTPQGWQKTLADLGNFAGTVGYEAQRPGAIPAGIENFMGDVVNWASGAAPAAKGQGAGDIRSKKILANLAKTYPKQSAAALGNATGGSVLDSYVPVTKTTAKKNVVTNATAKTSGATSGGGTVTPKTVANVIKQLNQRQQEEAAAKSLGVAYTPGQAAGTAVKMAQQAAMDERNATIDENLATVYSPLQELLSKQQTAAENRYADNQANIKSIFGALSSLSAQDAARIDKQFTTSIAKQQTDLANRVAEQRAATAAGTEQAVATGAERGTGPAMATNAIGVAAEQGIGQANAAQQNWEGLMGAQQTQAGLDATARGTGYKQQELGAMDTLRRGFEDTLSQFDAKAADLESQIAQSKLAQQQALAAGDVAAAQAEAKIQADLDIQKLKNEGAMNVATLRAQTQLATRSSGGASSSTTKLKGVEAVQAKSVAAGIPFDQLQNGVNEAYQIAYQLVNPEGSTKVTQPSKAIIQGTWNRLMQSSPQRGMVQAGLANQLIDSMF